MGAENYVKRGSEVIVDRVQEALQNRCVFENESVHRKATCICCCRESFGDILYEWTLK